MVESGQAPPCSRDVCFIQFHDQCLLAFLGTAYQLSPGINCQRMSIKRNLCFLIHPALPHTRDIAKILNSPGLEQHLPMHFSCRLGKGSSAEHEITGRIVAEKFRKTEIIADGKTNTPTSQFEVHWQVAVLIDPGFINALW